jgi:hypothetical protein
MTLRRRVEDHLGSRDVAHVLYGAIVGLALVVALEDHPPAAGTTAVLLMATALAIGLAELYSETISIEARTRRIVARAQLRRLATESVATVLGAAFPALFFVLSVLGALSVDTAFTLSKWSGLGLICGYGFLAARLAGTSIARGLAHAAILGLIAGALIAVKAVLH